MTYKVLVVDNEPADLEVTKLLLSSDPDFAIQTQEDAETAIEIIRQRPNDFAAIVLDYHMPKDGLQTGYASGCHYMGKESYDWNPTEASLHMFEN